MRTLGLLLAVACQAQTFRVAGTILNSESAAPVGKARISLIATGRTRTVVTAPDGRFSFDVPAGKYSLVADVREMRQGYGLRTPNAGFGIAIIAGPDQKTDDLVFRWFPPAVLTGRILDSFGEPVERAQISMTRIAVLNGERHVYFYGNRYTDDRGEYRFAPILPGSYYVRVSATPWYASNTLPRGMHSAAEDRAAYATVFYPGTRTARAATPIAIKPGQEGRADFTLDETHGVAIHVHCDCGKDSKSLTLIEEGVNGFQDQQRTATIVRGEAEFTSVAPGRYAIRITGQEDGQEVIAWQVVEAGASDVDVRMAPKPAPSISGKVEFQNPASRPQRSIRMQMMYDVTGFVFAKTVAADGSFEFPGLQPARYQPIGIAGQFASDIFTEDGALHEGYFDLSDGRPVKIRVVASDATSRVKGYVKLGDRAIPGVTVLLAAQKDSANHSRYRAFQTDSDGSFDIQNVRPGDYYLFAVDQPELEYASPAALRPYFETARPIRIEPTKTYDEIVPLSTQVRQAIP